MTYIPYIYVTKENGFVDNVKFMQEIDLSILKPSDNIKVYYDETYPFYNVAIKNEDNSYTIFQEDNLIILSQDKIENHIKDIFPKLLNQVVSSNVGDLLNDYKNEDGSTKRLSLFKEYLNHIEYKTKVQLIPEKENFSLEYYQNLSNELVFLSDCLENVKLSHFIKSSVRAFNTFLGYEGIITDFSGGSFKTSIDEETNKETIYFSDASQSLSYAIDRCEYNLNLKTEIKKLKI